MPDLFWSVLFGLGAVAAGVAGSLLRRPSRWRDYAAGVLIYVAVFFAVLTAVSFANGMRDRDEATRDVLERMLDREER